jgi:hypothetical protein
MLQQTTRRHQAPMMTARYRHPRQVGRWLMSAHHHASGWLALNCRWTRCCAACGEASVSQFEGDTMQWSAAVSFDAVLGSPLRRLRPHTLQIGEAQEET